LNPPFIKDYFDSEEIVLDLGYDEAAWSSTEGDIIGIQIAGLDESLMLLKARVPVDFSRGDLVIEYKFRAEFMDFDWDASHMSLNIILNPPDSGDFWTDPFIPGLHGTLRDVLNFLVTFGPNDHYGGIVGVGDSVEGGNLPRASAPYPENGEWVTAKIYISPDGFSVEAEGDQGYTRTETYEYDNSELSYIAIGFGDQHETKVEVDYIKGYYQGYYEETPVAQFTANKTEGPCPLTVQFFDQSTGEITSWFWEFGDGETSTEQNPSHTYNSTGYFTVSLTVTGPGGSDTKTKENYIHVAEVATPGATSISQSQSDGTEIPEGDIVPEGTIVFKATLEDPDGDDVRLEIELRKIDEPFTGEPTSETISDFAPSDSEVTITRSGLVDGEYHWQYRVRDSRGAVSEWKEFGEAGNVDFKVGPLRIISFTANPTTADTVPCEVSFTCKANGVITEYRWDFDGDGVIDEITNANQTTHTYTEAGAYKAGVTVVGDTGGTASKTRVIRVGDLLAKYAPVLTFTHLKNLSKEQLGFSPKEQYFPTNYKMMTQKSELWAIIENSMATNPSVTATYVNLTEKGINTPDELHAFLDNPSAYGVDFPWLVESVYFDLKNCDQESCFVPHMEPSDCVVYAREVKDDNDKIRFLQYWFFYIYNDWKNKHEGDWEHITIKLKDNQEPEAVMYSRHYEVEAVKWEKVEKSEGHPVVYVGLGSHASYPFKDHTFFSWEVDYHYGNYWWESLKGTLLKPDSYQLLSIEESGWLAFKNLYFGDKKWGHPPLSPTGRDEWSFRKLTKKILGLLQKPSEKIVETTAEIQTGMEKAVRVPIDSVKKIYVKVSLLFNSNIDTTLVAPDGTIINSQVAQTDPNITYIPGDTSESYIIEQPMPGEWEIRVEGDDIEEEGEPLIVTVTADSNLTLSIDLDKDEYLPGAPIIIKTTLKDDLGPILNANVVANVQTPSSNEVITLYDDGNHNDGAANDGIYANTYLNTQETGAYAFKVDASGVSNGGDAFTRTATKAVIVSGGSNGDGTVTIDEVQKCINCFLGIENDCCDRCDLNNDDQVTIDEVQKVINAFLGIVAPPAPPPEVIPGGTTVGPGETTSVSEGETVSDVTVEEGGTVTVPETSGLESPTVSGTVEKLGLWSSHLTLSWSVWFIGVRCEVQGARCIF